MSSLHHVQMNPYSSHFHITLFEPNHHIDLINDFRLSRKECSIRINRAGKLKLEKLIIESLLIIICAGRIQCAASFSMSRRQNNSLNRKILICKKFVQT